MLKLILKAAGAKGVPQGGVISPLLSNLYLNEVDRMLERAKEVTREGEWTRVEYARYADDLVILVDGHPSTCVAAEGGGPAAPRGARQARSRGQRGEEPDRGPGVRGESFGFLGFDFRRVRSLRGRWRPQYTPKLKKRTALLEKLKEVFRRFDSQPVGRVIAEINPILRGWVNYFRIGNAGRCFAYVRTGSRRRCGGT